MTLDNSDIRGNNFLTSYTTHSKESNTISEFGVARKNWCILSIRDKIEKFSIFSKVYENIKMGWSGENFHKANIFMNPPDAGYDPFAFSVSN